MLFQRTVLALAAAMLLGGCGAASTANFSPPASAQRAARGGAAGAHIVLRPASGGVWIAYTTQAHDSIRYLAFPYTTVTKTISKGVTDPIALALNGKSQIAVLNGLDNYNGKPATVAIYSTKTLAPVATITAAAQADVFGIAFDSSNSLYLIERQTYSQTKVNVQKFAYPYTKGTTVVASSPCSAQYQRSTCVMIVDAMHNVLVTDQGGSAVHVYLASQSYAKRVDIVSQVQNPVSLHLDTTGNLFVGNGNQYSGLIAEYPPGKNASNPYGQPFATFTLANAMAGPMLTDKSGDLVTMQPGCQCAMTIFVRGAAGLRNAQAFDYAINPSAMAVDSAQNLIVSDNSMPSSGTGLLAFTHPYPINAAKATWNVTYLGASAQVQAMIYEK
jgi:hypothetical protein